MTDNSGPLSVTVHAVFRYLDRVARHPLAQGCGEVTADVLKRAVKNIGQDTINNTKIIILNDIVSRNVPQGWFSSPRQSAIQLNKYWAIVKDGCVVTVTLTEPIGLHEKAFVGKMRVWKLRRLATGAVSIKKPKEPPQQPQLPDPLSKKGRIRSLLAGHLSPDMEPFIGPCHLSPTGYAVWAWSTDKPLGGCTCVPACHPSTLKEGACL